MADFNPYAPPTPAADAPAPAPGKSRGGGTGVWQENGLLIFEKAGGALPPRCVVCNARSTTKHRRTFMWHPAGYYLLMLAGWLIYALVIPAVRKTVTLELGVCDVHDHRRRNGLLIAGLGAGGSLLLLMLVASSHFPELIALCIFAAIGFAIGGLRMARLAAVSRIDDTHAWLKVGPQFLASLPTSPDEEPLLVVKKKKKKVKKAPRPAAEREAGKSEPAATEAAGRAGAENEEGD